MKSDIKSATLRGEGNKFYSDRNFYDALLKYNESLCHASLDGENLGHAFANRSAVYFEMKLFGNSLKNIEFARVHNYPVESLETLAKREAKCHELMKQKLKFNSPWEFFKLSYKSNKRLPFAVHCLELRTNEKYGNHIITNQTVKVGDVLAIESPFCSVLLKQTRLADVENSNIYQRCAYCLRDNQLDLFPCFGCSGGKKKYLIIIE